MPLADAVIDDENLGNDGESRGSLLLEKSSLCRGQSFIADDMIG